VTDPEGLSASDQCSVIVGGAASGRDLSGQWLSLSRTVKRSVSTFKGKIRVKNLGGQSAPSFLILVYQSADTVLNTSSDPLVGKATVTSIPAAGYVDVSPRLSGTYNGSPVYLIAVLDSNNVVSETNETNNKVLSALLQ
jgi:subtilase family serine protease